MRPSALALGLGVVALAAGCSSGSSGGAPPPTPPATIVTATPTPTHSHTHRPATPVATPTASPSVTVTQTTPVAAGPCASAHLALSVGLGQGTAGTSYQVLVLTNTGSATCTLFGYPGVSFVTSSGALIGRPSSRDHGRVRTITLHPGGAANALSRQPEPGNFAASVCRPRTADRVRVYPPGQTVALFASNHVQLCSTGAGRTGIGPMLAGDGGSP
jgi:Protein of unknown function (DUF4232)